MKILIIAVFLLCLHSLPVYAKYESLFLAFAFPLNGGVHLRGATWFLGDDEFQKYRIGHSPSDGGDRVFYVELLNKNEKVVDTAELHLNSALPKGQGAALRHKFVDVDQDAEFSPRIGMYRVRIKREEEIIFDRKIAELLIEQKIASFNSGTFDGIPRLKVFFSGHVYVKGKEIDFLKALASISNECGGLKKDDSVICEAVHRNALNTIKFSLP